MNEITIKTRDGDCRCFVFKPEGDGPWPGVLMYMDGLGIRPAMLDIGKQLAERGYYVLLPDLFYRSGPYEPMDPQAIFADPDGFKVIKEKYMAPATVEAIMSDTGAFLDFLEKQPEVKSGPVGVTGYCMGGRFSLAAAGTWPERIAACGSFHGGNLAAADAEDSPHKLAPHMQARIFVAGATDDGSFPDDMKERLEKALTDAGVTHTIETWPAKHGWTFSDFPVYDKACSERHLKVLDELFGSTLGG